LASPDYSLRNIRNTQKSNSQLTLDYTNHTALRLLYLFPRVPWFHDDWLASILYVGACAHTPRITSGCRIAVAVLATFWILFPCSIMLPKADRLPYRLLTISPSVLMANVAIIFKGWVFLIRYNSYSAKWLFSLCLIYAFTQMPGYIAVFVDVERVAKYIPGEIVAGYLALSEVVKMVSRQDTRRVAAAWVLFLVGLGVTPVYLYVAGKPANRREMIQIGISTIAFVLWAYALGGPFEMGPPSPVHGPYAGWIGALAVGIFTWVAGLFRPWLKGPVKCRASLAIEPSTRVTCISRKHDLSRQVASIGEPGTLPVVALTSTPAVAELVESLPEVDAVVRDTEDLGVVR
jgi:hypothetical protein